MVIGQKTSVRTGGWITAGTPEEWTEETGIIQTLQHIQWELAFDLFQVQLPPIRKGRRAPQQCKPYLLVPCTHEVPALVSTTAARPQGSSTLQPMKPESMLDAELSSSSYAVRDDLS
jgi:hypothetical protein